MPSREATDGTTVSLNPVLEQLDAVVERADGNQPREAPHDRLEDLLAKQAQFAAILRADDVYALLKSGDSALLAGALGRSLVETAAAEQWYVSRHAAEQARTATLALERENIANYAHEQGLSVPNLARWNNPIPDSRFSHAPVGGSLPNLQSSLSDRASTTVEMITRLPAPFVDLLAMCSHVSHVASWLTVQSGEHELGVTGSPSFVALLAQSSGSALASIRGFSGEEIVASLDTVATKVHGFNLLPPLGKEKVVASMNPGRSAAKGMIWIESPPPEHLDHHLSILQDKATRVWHIVNNAPNPFARSAPGVNLTSALPYLAARAVFLKTITATRGGHSPFVAPTGARMLLEQGSEMAWRTEVPSDDELRKRYNAVMDDATDRKMRLEQRLISRTSARFGVETLLYPLGRGDNAIDTRRAPQNDKAKPPAPGVHLGALDLGDAEPNWGGLAYKLLTQVAHATPLGILHVLARQEPHTLKPLMSHEMTALAIDSACVGVALTLRSLTPVITLQAGLPDATEWLHELFSEVRAVHHQAQILHFLG